MLIAADHAIFSQKYFILAVFSVLHKTQSAKYVESNFNGSNIVGTIEICLRHGQFEPLRVYHGARPGSKCR